MLSITFQSERNFTRVCRGVLLNWRIVTFERNRIEIISSLHINYVLELSNIRDKLLRSASPKGRCGVVLRHGWVRHHLRWINALRVIATSSVALRVPRAAFISLVRTIRFAFFLIVRVKNVSDYD